VSGTTTSLLLVLSALLHALWNTILKRDGDPRASAIGVLALGALGATLAVPLASGPAFRDWASVGWGIGAGICEGGYFIALALALERAPLGVSYTVSRGSAMILVWAVSALALTHPVRAAEISSAALILAGVALTQPAVAAEQSRRRTQGIRWAYLCGGFIAGYHFLYARAMREATQAAALFSRLLRRLVSDLSLRLAHQPATLRDQPAEHVGGLCPVLCLGHRRAGPLPPVGRRGSRPGRRRLARHGGSVNISELVTLGDLDRQIASADPRTWLVLDIDQTILRAPGWHGSEPWYYRRIEHYRKQGLAPDEAVLRANAEWEAAHATIAAVPMERETAAWIARWQRLAPKLLAATARRPEMETRTRQQLAAIGIDLSHSAPPPPSAPLGEPIAYRAGILYLGPLLEKGPAFRALIERVDRRPTAVWFVDDRAEHVHSMGRQLAALGIAYRGYRYQAADRLTFADSP
jgi:multidrug transporter EmrE-like cation transporter